MKFRLTAIIFLFMASASMLSASQARSRISGNWNVDSIWANSRSGAINAKTTTDTIRGTGTLFTSELTVGNVLQFSLNDLNALGVIKTIVNDTVLILTSHAASAGAGTFEARRSPASADTVTITQSTSVTINFSDIRCSRIVIGRAGSYAADRGYGKVIFNTGSKLTVNDYLYLGTSTQADSGVVDMTNGGTLVLHGSSYGATYMRFTSGTGTVTFNSAGPQSVPAFTYNDVNIDSAGTAGIGTGTMTINGTLSVLAGTLTLTANNLLAKGATQIYANGTLSSTTGTATFAGDVTNNGVISPGTAIIFKKNFLNFGTFNQTAGKTTFDGTVQQTIGGLQTPTFFKLSLSDPDGIFLTHDINVNDSLIVLNGTVTTNANKINVLSTVPGKVSFGAAGSINGEIIRSIDADVAGTYYFTDARTSIAIAAGGPSLPVITVDFKSFPGIQPQPAPSTGTAADVYYQITPSGVLTASSLKLSYSHDYLHGITETHLWLFHHTGTSWEYIPCTLDTLNNILTASNISTWSSWTFGDAASPLPIVFSAFNGAATDGQLVKLEWSTMTEERNYGFYVERRAESEAEFKTVSGLIPGAGTSLEEHFYTWNEQIVSPGTYFYRLRQVDVTGTQSCSNDIRIVVSGLLSVGDPQTPRVFSLGQNYPNPFNPTTRISFTVDKAEHAALRVYNVLGEEVATLFNASAEPGKTYDVEFNAHGMTSGVYYCRLVTGNRSDMKKMVLMR